MSKKCPKCGAPNGLDYDPIIEKRRCLWVNCNYIEEDNEVHFRAFFDKMTQKIKDSQPKRGDRWKTGSIYDLRSRIFQEFREWCRAKDEKESIELIDIANQAMLLWIRLNIKEL